jgi:hypothetical protein
MPRTWQNSFTHFDLRAAHEDEHVLAAEHLHPQPLRPGPQVRRGRPATSA